MINSIIQFFIGIDISKETLDYTILQGKQLIAQAKIANKAGGLSKLKSHLKKLGIPLSKTLICCENTGIFNHPLITWSKKENANLWIENAKIIKNGVFVECWHYETLIFSFDTSSLKAEIMLDLSNTSNRQIKDW